MFNTSSSEAGVPARSSWFGYKSRIEMLRYFVFAILPDVWVYHIYHQKQKKLFIVKKEILKLLIIDKRMPISQLKAF